MHDNKTLSLYLQNKQYHILTITPNFNTSPFVFLCEGIIFNLRHSYANVIPNGVIPVQAYVSEDLDPVSLYSYEKPG